MLKTRARERVKILLRVVEAAWRCLREAWVSAWGGSGGSGLERCRLGLRHQPNLVAGVDEPLQVKAPPMGRDGSGLVRPLLEAAYV